MEKYLNKDVYNKFMKRSVFIIFLVLLLSVSFVSAAWLETDYGWKWISGKAITNVAGVIEPYTKTINGIEIKVIFNNYVDDKSKRVSNVLINGQFFKLTIGTFVTVDGKNIALEAVGSAGSIKINVDGVVDEVQGPIITIVSSVFNDLKEGRSAVLNVNGNQYGFKVDEARDIDNMNIKLINVGSGGDVIIQVNGVMDTLEGPLPITNERIITLKVDECNGFGDAQICLVNVGQMDQALIMTQYKVNQNVTINKSFPIRLGNTDVYLLETYWNELKIDRAAKFKFIYTTENMTYIGPPIPVNETEVITPTEKPVIITPEQICNGCKVDDICIPFGTRQKGQYCDIDKTFKPQVALNEACENSYECKSNECSDGKCISTAGLLQRLLDFLSRIFGKGQ